MKTVKAFYFAKEDRKLRYGDNRDIVVGETHSVEGEIAICHNGLHASEKLINAMRYAPGNILYLVELSGDMHRDEDKIAARHRKYLAEIDTTELMKKFCLDQVSVHFDSFKEYFSHQFNSRVESYLKTGEMQNLVSTRRELALVYKENRENSKLRAHLKCFSHSLSTDTNRLSNDAYWCARESYWADNILSDVFFEDDFEEKFNTILTEMVKQATGWDL